MIKTTRLDNGMTLVSESLEGVKSVSIGIWIKNGSIDETKENNGISHFIEHMMFKGSAKRDAKQIAQDMARIGGRINAFTAKEYTCYYAHILEAHLPIALDVLADMVTHPLLDDDEIVKEKRVILDELAMSEDNPEDIVHDQLENYVLRPSALSLDILGTKETIKGFTKASLQAYIKSHYVAENMVVAVAGSFDEVWLIETLNKYFKDISDEKPLLRDLTVSRKDGFVFKDKDIEQVHMVMNYPSISYKSDKSYVLTVLNTLIGGGINSKLFLGIREDKGLTYSIYSYVESYEATGLFNIYAAFNPELAEEVISNTFIEINKFLDEGMTEEELYSIKEQIKSNLIIGYENMNHRMSHYGESKLILGRIKTQEEIIEGIDNVSVEAVMAMATKIFRESTMSLSLVGKLNQLDQERIKNLCKK